MFENFTPAALLAVRGSAHLTDGEITPDHLAAACLNDSRGRAFAMTHLETDAHEHLHESALDACVASTSSPHETHPFSDSLRAVFADLAEVPDVGLDTLLVALSHVDGCVLHGVDLQSDHQPILTPSRIASAMNDGETIADLAHLLSLDADHLSHVLAGRHVLTQAESDTIRAELGLCLPEPGIRLEHSDEVVTNAHDAATCAPRPCTIHRRSDHHLRDLPQHWRADAHFIERVCRHGIGHPDPDEVPDVVRRVHGCDGCCTPITS